MPDLNDIETIPTKTEIRRVRGGYLDHWSLREVVQVPGRTAELPVGDGRRIYLSGPMSGLQDMNYPAFNAEAARLRGLGHCVENPAENPEPTCKTWTGYMRLALVQMMRCDTVALMPGWAASRGATIECRIAAELGMSIVFAHEVTA